MPQTDQMRSQIHPPSSVPVSSCGPEFDVQGSDAQLLAPLGHILGSQHGCIWRGLISVSLHLHPTSHSADGFLARKIGNMDKGVIEGCKDVADTKHILSLSHLRSQADDLLFLLFRAMGTLEVSLRGGPEATVPPR